MARFEQALYGGRTGLWRNWLSPAKPRCGASRQGTDWSGTPGRRHGQVRLGWVLVWRERSGSDGHVFVRPAKQRCVVVWRDSSGELRQA